MIMNFRSLATGLLLSSAIAAHADVLFSDNFDGASTPLHGTTPDTTLADAAWVSADWLADGTIAVGSGNAADHSAFLPFVPLPGNIYTLTATMTQPSGGDATGWVAIGFTRFSATSGSFWANDAAPWMLWRPGTASSPNEVASFRGPQTGGALSVGTATGTATFTIVLNTEGTAWTVEWKVNGTPLRQETYDANPSITHIGFGRENGQSSTFSHFSLTVTGDHPPPPPPPPAPEPLATFTLVTDGDPTTDENGYAGSATNNYSYQKDNLITVGNQQFITYYRRHATDSSDPANNTVLIARRTLGESVWEIFSTDFTATNINNTHCTISMAIDGNGLLHMAWGVHNHSLRYARSTASVLGSAPIQMVSLGANGMTGAETSVTYPMFQTLPGGDLLFFFRAGGSGNGNWFLNRYDTATGEWSPLHADTNGSRRPFFQGTGHSPSNCFYPDRFTLGPDGVLHVSGVFRESSSSLQTNHRYVYLRSPDEGLTWQRADGSPISLPAVNDASFLNLGPHHVPEIVEDIPQGYSLINQSGLTTDSAGRPVIANWWAADAATDDHTRQYHIFFHDGDAWQRRTVSARDIDPTTQTPNSEFRTRRMGRPVVLTDADDRIIVLYNDNRFDGQTAVFSLPLAQDPGRHHWTRVNLTHENLGIGETTYDETRWKRDGVLHMLYQKLPGLGMDYSGQNNSTPVFVAEWDARAYFNGPVEWAMDTETTPGEAAIIARTRTGFRYDLRTSTDLDFSAPPVTTLPGDGNWWDFGTWSMDEPRRFWQIQRTEEATNEL